MFSIFLILVIDLALYLEQFNGGTRKLTDTPCVCESRVFKSGYVTLCKFYVDFFLVIHYNALHQLASELMLDLDDYHV